MSLTQSQREKINHFKSVTNIDNDNIAQVALQRCNWDINSCITMYFENPDSLLSGRGNNASHSRSQQPPPQQPQQPQQQQQQPQPSQPSAIGYYASYIPGLTSLGSLISSMFSYLAPFLPYFSSIFSMFNTSASSISYNEILTEFKKENKIFSEIQNDAIFRNQRFGELMNTEKCLFIFFNDISSNQCNKFVKDILCKPSVIDYLRNNMECWIGDNRNNDGRQLFRQITHEWNEKRKPFICIAGIHPISRKLVLVHRQYVGNISSPLLFIGNILDHGLQRWQTFKLQQIQNHAASASNRHLREAQDREYLMALQQEQIKQEQEQQQQQQQQQQAIESEPEPQSLSLPAQNDQKYENRQKTANEKIQSLNDMIESSTKDKLIKVALRLPNGKRVQHIFCNENTVESLFDFALCHELKIDDEWIDGFELVCNYPKRIFTQNDKHLTLKDVGIEKSTIIFVQQSESA